jgi:T-complex protein 1 subunit beta
MNVCKYKCIYKYIIYIYIFIYIYSYSNTHDNYHDHSEFEQDLLDIARTTLSSKLLNVEKDHFARLAVDAVLRLKGSGNLDYIQVIKKPGGSLADSFLEEGFVLNKVRLCVYL